MNIWESVNPVRIVIKINLLLLTIVIALIATSLITNVFKSQAVELSDYDKMCSLTAQIHDQNSLLADLLQKKIDQFDNDEILMILQADRKMKSGNAAH